MAEWSLPGAVRRRRYRSRRLLGLDPRWKLGTADTLDLTPVPGADPVVALMPRPTDGPVVVTVAYTVPDGEMVGFADAMRVVEAHRRRTGAYQWGLFRDLAEPHRFVEMFHVESWAAHLRQHQRVTAHFDEQWESVRRLPALDRGAEPPPVGLQPRRARDARPPHGARRAHDRRIVVLRRPHDHW